MIKAFKMNQVTMISCMNQTPINSGQFKKIYLKRRYNLVRRNRDVSIGKTIEILLENLIAPRIKSISLTFLVKVVLRDHNPYIVTLNILHL